MSALIYSRQYALVSRRSWVIFLTLAFTALLASSVAQGLARSWQKMPIPTLF